MIKDSKNWAGHWQLGVNPDLERIISTGLIKVFNDFWSFQKLNEKSKSTQNRYSNALFLLGAYFVEEACDNEDEFISALSYLSDETLKYGGPLIAYADEQLQNEIDLVCRKLYAFIKES
ncbi:hypothetical protein ABMY33_21510 [Vibrio vulnificus]|uniref:hypothetical protein n=1 Tax=Vibrio vulnificus TaxID=672 RepID=UPI001A206636|nr:hypothetical protein [Vibrio vulnificus]EKA7356762.1 hypothetical protein [Vibrio vulnificus]